MPDNLVKPETEISEGALIEKEKEAITASMLKSALASVMHRLALASQIDSSVEETIKTPEGRAVVLDEVTTSFIPALVNHLANRQIVKTPKE